MNTGTIQQEILLMTTTTFSKRRWHNNETPDNRKSLSDTEQLEEICWNGLLKEMLPEIIVRSSSGKDLYLWQIRNGKSYLQIELCEFPLEIEKLFSIDPHFFLGSMNYN